MSARVPARSMRKNLPYVVGLVVLAGTFAGVPLFFKARQEKLGNLTTQKNPLSGNQIMRGAYINSGSIDAGVDEDWDPVTRSYKGQATTRFVPSDDEVAEARKRLEEKLQSVGLK